MRKNNILILFASLILASCSDNSISNAGNKATNVQSNQVKIETVINITNIANKKIKDVNKKRKRKC